jgi:DNA-binding NarL/FixJ family response regulator
MPIKIEINALTGEEVVSEITAEEIAVLKQMAEKEAEVEAEKVAKKLARQSALAKLAALGLTEAEIAAL